MIKKTCRKSFFLWARVLSASSSSILFPQRDLLIHKHLFHNLTLGCAEEYSQATCALAPFFLTPMSSNTTSIVITLHPKLDGYFPVFFKNYELNHDLKFFFFQVSILTHVTFISKWSFWDGF
jgi:hypothetical protein